MAKGFEWTRINKDFNPDLSKINLRKKLNDEETQFLHMLLDYFTTPLEERTLDNACLPATADLEMFLSMMAEEHSLSPHELSDTVKTAVFGLLRKYTIINLEVNKQAFKQEMK